MKTYRYTYIFLMALFSAIAVSCEVDEVTDAPAADALVHKVFHATIEEDGLTKTMLDETAVDGVRGMLWDPGDVIGIGIQGSTFRKFTNVVAEPTANGVFEGDINEENTYYAIYPWQENKTMTTELTVDIPSRQTYRANSFDINMAPMVGKGNNGESIHFQNLCGILAISMKGTDVIKSISLTAKDVKGNKALISGQFTVDMGYETFPYPMPTEQSLTNVAIDCGEGVQLDSEKETYFHILLPPGTYYGLDLLITTADARFMTLSTDKTLTVKRSVLTKTSALEFMENVGEEMITDLSLRGNSNCYIVPSEGIYSFDATVIGNGEFGIIPGADFHTDIPEITPASVELLWEDRAGLIQGYVYDPSEGRVKLIVSDLEGNALIAAKDADGTILWSWHIWITDYPEEHIYANNCGTFYVMDRNIGALRSDQGSEDEYKDTHGLLYQWGRKDPFNLEHYSYLPYSYTPCYSILDIIKNPTALSVAQNGYGSADNWTYESIVGLWSETQKTIYDPCPNGYRVASSSVWEGLVNDSIVDGVYDHGLMLNYCDSDMAWYPFTTYHDVWLERINTQNATIQIWSSTQEILNNSKWTSERVLYCDNSSIQLSDSFNDLFALSVRCMKDKDYVDISLPSISTPTITDVTSKSATVSYSISNTGNSDVIETGILLSCEYEITLQNSIKIVCNTNEDQYISSFTDLTPNQVYYVKAYAINSSGTSYSDPQSFYTLETQNSDWIYLCTNGPANCYIVKPDGNKYAFDCSRKGNTNESVGQIHSPEIIWETQNTTNSVTEGSVISDISMIGNNIIITPSNPGNALIAVKDINDIILWSWHIWVCDYDPEETAQNYISGAVMMDRNLGALGLNGVESYGMYYQWGRKDPFVENSNTYPADIKEYIQESEHINVEYTIHNPTKVIICGNNWNRDQSLWGRNKALYDPCPPGWRVPDGGSDSVWIGLQSVLNGSASVFEEPYSIPAAYYPKTGLIADSEPFQMGSIVYCWSCNRGYGYSNSWYNENDTFCSITPHFECPVRCMKD